MIAIVCLDDRNGMLFHRRRQSRDRAVAEDIVKEIVKTAGEGGGCLRMNAYSAPLFEGACGGLLQTEVSEDFLEIAREGDYCFVENVPLAPYAGRLRGMILYRWNRHYPGDFFLDCEPSPLGFSLRETAEFPGTSHERITKEVYGK